MAQTGRAELLRALHLGAADALVLEHDDHTWWGYQRQADAGPAPDAPMLVLPPAPGPQRLPLPPADGPVEDPLKQPLQMPLAWALRAQTSRDLPQELAGLPKLTEADLRALAPDPLPYRDLVPWPRALPGIRRHTDRAVAGSIDWPRLGDALARQALPRELPRRTWQRWPQRVLLVLDFSPRLAPYHWDFHRLAMQLDAQLPVASLSVRLLQHGPAGPWSAWAHPRKTKPWQAPQDWEVQLAPDTVMLLATDLGLFDHLPTTHQAWIDWGAALKAQGCRLIALAPVGAAQPTAAAVQRFELLRWSPDSRWRREQRAPAPHGDEQADSAAAAPTSAADPGLEALVALAATALRIDPPLLRAWRSLLPAGGDAGLEGRLWNHPHLQPSGLTCATRPEHLDADLAQLEALPRALREAARAAHAAQHAHLRQSMGQGEALRWHVAAWAYGPAAVPGQDLNPAGDDPLGFVKRLLYTLGDGAPPLAPADQRSLVGAAELIRAAASARVRAQDPGLFAALDAAVARWRSGRPGGGSPEPAEYAAQRPWVLVQSGAALELVPASTVGAGQQLGSAVLAPASAQEVLLQSPAGNRWLALGTDGVDLACWDEPTERLTVILDRHHWVLEQVRRPFWAAQWRQAQGQVEAGVPSPGGVDIQGQPEVAWFRHPWLPHVLEGGAQGRVRAGLDACGAFAEVALHPPAGHRRKAEQDLSLRLRWIPPGRFLMGSPEGEGHEYERPQHPVLISQGFWLAKGPCTQALWQAVTGANPSHFKKGPDAPQRPVEQVSFDEVQQFLQRLRAWLPEGCDPVLPTEAQWEHAARAGTTTAYPWGDAPDDTRANWSQQHHGTTPVGRFEPNPWGLLDMHGNVWEWCADDRRDYTAPPQRDPHGGLDRTSGRAVRGGSWISRPGLARSAFRDGGRPGDRIHYLGFRLALRSSSPGAGGSPAEPARRAQVGDP